MREWVEVSDGDRWSGVLGDRKLKSEANFLLLVRDSLSPKIVMSQNIAYVCAKTSIPLLYYEILSFL